MTTTSSLDGWDIGLLKDVEWMPSSTDGNTEAKLLAVADRFHVMLAEAHAGVPRAEPSGVPLPHRQHVAAPGAKVV